MSDRAKILQVRLKYEANDLIRQAYSCRGDLSAHLVTALVTLDLYKIALKRFPMDGAAREAEDRDRPARQDLYSHPRRSV
jgi:hypothetical protein